MKAIIIIFSVALILVSCEKDKITGKDILGNWLLETRNVDTIYENGSRIDTNIVVDNLLYIINNIDTLGVRNVNEVTGVKYTMDYIPPNIISYYSCPIDFLCIFGEQIQYKVLAAGNAEMVWQKHIELSSKKVIETLYFRKQN